jgi:hypothetical protein
MSRKSSTHATLGFRVKSGCAVAVLLGGSAQTPAVLDRRVIELCDPGFPETRRPYHAAMGKLETDGAKIQRRRKVVVRAAEQSVSELIKEHAANDISVRGAALVVGSQIDPAKIGNPHVRAHALEGQLFRTVLEDALRSSEVRSIVVRERDLYKRAAEVLGRSELELKVEVATLGRGRKGPWRADEKAACLAAWVARREGERTN